MTEEKEKVTIVFGTAVFGVMALSFFQGWAEEISHWVWGETTARLQWWCMCEHAAATFCNWLFSFFDAWLVFVEFFGRPKDQLQWRDKHFCLCSASGKRRLLAFPLCVQHGWNWQGSHWLERSTPDSCVLQSDKIWLMLRRFLKALTFRTSACFRKWDTGLQWPHPRETVKVLCLEGVRQATRIHQCWTPHVGLETLIFKNPW